MHTAGTRAYVLYQEVIYMQQDGNVTHLPKQMAQDVCRAYDWMAEHQ
jgi:hypothetical protein